MTMETVGGIPVECLTGELAGVWSGWRTLGDREVVREASAKGTHIDLAQKCIATRRNCSMNDAQNYFYREVDVWVEELLVKQQVFRATHIVKNVGKNPQERINAVCIKSRDRKLRDYLVRHLRKIDGLEESQLEAWELVEFCDKYRLRYSIEDDPISGKSIEEIIQMPEDAKIVLCTDLYFHTFEPGVSKKLSGPVAWDYLLMKNRIDFLTFWIDVNYRKADASIANFDPAVSEELKNVFERLKISDDMIDAVHKSSAASIVKELVLDHLARFGVFAPDESVNVKSVLTRLLNNKISPSDFRAILSQSHSKIKADDFVCKLNVDLYSKSYLEENRMQESDRRNRRLCSALEAMSDFSEDRNVFEKGILATVDYVSNNSVEFLRENPLILLALIFSRYQQQQASDSEAPQLLKAIFNDEDGFKLRDETDKVSKEVLDETLRRFPQLEKALGSGAQPKDATMYELLNGYENFNANRGFLWRQRIGQIPTFFNEYLVKRYGHKEKLNYVNYLKQGRPNMAARLLMYDQRKFHPDISSKMKCQASTEAHVFALRNLGLREITSACVSFIETIGVDSKNLRLHLDVAKRIEEDLGVSTGEQLEAVVYNNPAEIGVLASHLEKCFKRRVAETLEENPEDLITAIKDWDLNVRFARAHNTTLPDNFLEYLVKRDLYFEFLLVGQIFAYPVDQMLKIAKKVSNPNVKSHLLACLNNPCLSAGGVIDLPAGESKNRDSRQSLYSRIGLKQSNSRSSSPAESGSPGSGADRVSSESGIFATSDDLWMTILKSHHSQDPPGSLLQAARFHRSPLLVVLATCYEPSSIPAYWCSWLVISTNDSEVTADHQDYLDRQVWPADRVLELLKRLVALGYTKTVSRGLEIFMPESPLRFFTDFITQCVNFGDFVSGEKNLTAFRTGCSNLVRNANIGWTDPDLWYLNNSQWIIQASIKCATTALAHSFASTASQLEFLRALASSNFEEAPDFKRILKVVEILSETQVNFNFSILAVSNRSTDLEKEFKRCLDQLAKTENYKDALRLCKAADIDCSEIIIAQWRKDFANSIDDEGKVETNFWKNCARDFENYRVGYEVAAQFYVEHAEKVVSHDERYEILKLAHETLKESSANPQIIQGVEMAMWKSCFLAAPDNLNINETPTTLDKLKTELMSSLAELQVTCELTEPSEKISVEKLIDRFIDAGDLTTALRIAKIFNFKHRDLQVLMLCLSLAEGETNPYQLTPQQRTLLSTRTRLKNQWQVPYRGKGLPKVASGNSTLASPNTEFATEAGIEASISVPHKQDKIECITQLEKLIEILNHGVTAGRKILLCYRLAAHLGRSYQSLLTLNDPIEFLEEIVVNDDCDYKLEVIKDVVAAYQVNNINLAQFLASKIVDTVTKHVEDAHVDQPMALWGYPLDGSFHVITELCSEPSLLGSKLLETAAKLLGRSYGENRDVKTLKVIVELLVRAHDCFTAACNMEGIASILRKSQQLANSLQNLKEWGLLVRLLTGVGRFTEMNYILQIIKENEQFEFLLKGKGLEKIPGLKTALLDFLKKNSPENKDLFNLVAHHFRLYSEIALTWEQEAKDAINKVLTEARNQGNPNPGEIRLTKNEANEKRLQLAMINYTHATEYYLQDSKLTLAYQCCHRAELVALQKSFFNSVNHNQQVQCVLNLKSAEIDKMICNDLNFAQANIVARAYNHPVDWGNVIYSHCVMRCDARYLKDFTNTHELTVSIIKDCAKRFQVERCVTKQMAESMEHLVSLVKDVECKYTLASQLGFKNVIETLLGNSSVSAYLKDTVWRKGYASTSFD